MNSIFIKWLKIVEKLLPFSLHSYEVVTSRTNSSSINLFSCVKKQVENEIEQQNSTEMENSNQEDSKFQLPKLEAFEVIKKNLATAGIIPKLAHQPFPFNWTISFGFVLLGSGIYCTSVFIIYDAKTFAEYTQSVYTDSLVTLIILALVITIFNVEKLFQYVGGNNNHLVNTSEYRQRHVENILLFIAEEKWPLIFF